MQTEPSFFNHSKQITEEFLSTAIIIDDQANFGDNNLVQPKTVVPPAARKRSSVKDADKELKEPTDKQEKSSVGQSHDLNAKKVINSFAQKGILCSVIKLEENEIDGLHETVAPLCENADLIIFDWELSQNSDKTALPLVKETIKHFNGSSPQQLRLIAIYTGATDIVKVYNQIKEELEKDSQVVDVKDNCCQIDACRLLVFAKEAAKTAEGIKKISFEGLADFLVEEYTLMTKGLLSNVIMKSLSVIKQNSHQILKSFSGLDSPFLTHRTCLPKPEEAEEHSATLISEEIQSLLEEYNVGNVSGFNALQLFIDEQAENTVYSLEPSNNKKEPLNKEQVLDFLENGISPSERERPEFLSRKQFENIFKHLTNMYSYSADGENLDLKYAALTTLRSKYSNLLPNLALGTIVKEISDHEKFWICLQPRCDSVRLSGDISFPFLPLGDSGKVHCVIPDGSDSFVRKKISLKFSHCKMIRFSANSKTKDIQSTQEKTGFIFEDVENNKFKFICELKFEYAQKLSNSFATEISRVATNNSEWLRRCEEKNL